MNSIGLPVSQDAFFDSSIRGVPPGESFRNSSIKSKNLSPKDGSMVLPVLTLDQSALRANTDHFLEFAKAEGLLLAPHAKTPMMPSFAASLVAGGAWGATVANVQQLSAMLAAGMTHIIYASPPGGRTGASHLATAVSLYPHAEIFVFLDSVETVKALDAALDRHGGTRVFGLIEVGIGRTGARDARTAIAIQDAILATNGRITLAGVATYEAAAVTGPDYQETFQRLFGLLEQTFLNVHHAVGDTAPLMITAGGSTFFDEVFKSIGPIARASGASLILRSGAIFFSDDGLYQRAFEAMSARGFSKRIAQAIKPVLSLWAEVISCPEPGLAIGAFGMRDAPNDQGLPVIRRVFRNGEELAISPAEIPIVEKLNDQHAFIRSCDILQVGDILELGISHPCTAFQRWNIVYGLDDRGIVESLLQTHFG